MSSIEALKEQARTHEQKEEWRKALSLYLQAIEKLAEEDQPDIGLYNRVGDLYIRVGEVDEAVSHYEEAVDLYIETELPNNAIAVCKKIIRNVPDRTRPYLRMGQIRAGQGFIVDARTNFLTYAERMQAEGEYDEAFRALTEFADLVPEDTDVRLLIAEQMKNHERTEEAVEQLIAGYRVAHDAGDSAKIQAFESKLAELAPELDLSTVVAGAGAGAEMTFESTALGGDDAVAYGEITLGSPAEEPTPAEEPAGVEMDFADIDLGGEEEIQEDDAPAAVSQAGDDGLEQGFGDFAEMGSSDFDLGGDSPPDEEAAEPLEEMDEVIGGELPMMSFDDDELDEDIGGELPMMSFDDEEEESHEAADLATSEAELDADVGADFDLAGMDPGEDEVELDEDIGGDLPLMSFGDEGEEPEEAGDFAASEADFDTDFGAFFGDDDAAEPADVETDAEMATHAEIEAEAEIDTDLPETEAEPTAGVEDDLSMEPEAPPAEERVAAAREESVAEQRTDDGETAGVVADVDEPTAPPAPPASPAQELDQLRARLADAPDDVELHQRAVELAFRTGDDGHLARAYADLGHALKRTGADARARAVFQQALGVDPELEDARAALLEGEAPSAPVKEVASSEDYVDLGAMILGDEPEEKTTRFKVAYEAPSGDEDADFAKMLSQFKAKVAENFDAADVKAHHDLGTAYKEMGLLDEAVEEFQAALRASSEHLPTYELLGQVFLEQGNADAALRVLKRAQDADWEVEDELIGIYYYTARAHEELGHRADAVEYYDRVFSLDINFADVTERLRGLR